MTSFPTRLFVAPAWPRKTMAVDIATLAGEEKCDVIVDGVYYSSE